MSRVPRQKSLTDLRVQGVLVFGSRVQLVFSLVEFRLFILWVFSAHDLGLQAWGVGVRVLGFGL